jgi:hypothetical protein
MIKLGNNSVNWIGGHSSWHNTSDGRFKTNVREDIPGLDFITKLRPVSYTWDLDALDRFMKIPENENNEHKAERKQERIKQEKVIHTGFIAQEVEEAAQQAGFDFDGVHHPANEGDPYSLAYAEFVVPIVKAVQEQQEMIDNHELQITDNKSKIENYEFRIANYESKIKDLTERLKEIEKLLKKQ